MAKHRRLKSGINNIAHHSISVLSYLHPLMGEIARIKKVRKVKVDILAESPGADFTLDKEQLRALGALKNFSNEILSHLGYSICDLDKLTLEFLFPSPEDQNWPSHCRGIIGVPGHVHEVVVDASGRKFRVPFMLSRAGKLFDEIE